jgi:hypothetical protein
VLLTAILNLLRFLKRFWSTRVVGEVPPYLHACEACGEAECSNERFTACEFRLRCKRVLAEGTSAANLAQATDPLSSDDNSPRSEAVKSGTRRKVDLESAPEQDADFIKRCV